MCFSIRYYIRVGIFSSVLLRKVIELNFALGRVLPVVLCIRSVLCNQMIDKGMEFFLHMKFFLDCLPDY